MELTLSVDGPPDAPRPVTVSGQLTASVASLQAITVQYNKACNKLLVLRAALQESLGEHCGASQNGRGWSPSRQGSVTDMLPGSEQTSRDGQNGPSEAGSVPTDLHGAVVQLTVCSCRVLFSAVDRYSGAAHKPRADVREGCACNLVTVQVWTECRRSSGGLR